MFLHSYHPDSILFQAGPFQIHWYGFLIALAIIVNFFIAKKLFKKYNLPESSLYDLGFYLIFFGIVGARVWHILSEINYYIKYPSDIFKIWNGGLAIHGAVLGGIIFLWIYLNKNKQFSFLPLLDIFAPLVALGQAIGRWGNYFNQELYGRPVEWGIPIDMAHRVGGYEPFQYFHPVFLYESIWCLLIFIFLIFLHQARIKKYNKKLQVTNYKLQVTKVPGLIFLLYLILYSLERFFIGFLRLDPMVTWYNLRLDQWVSLAITSISFAFFAYIIKNQVRQRE